VAQTYTIGRLAAAAGVNVETVRYYQRRRLIAEPARPSSGARRYGEEDAERLRFIKRSQEMGFTLSEVENLLDLRERRSCEATRELAAAKLEIIDKRIQELRKLRKELAGLVAECEVTADDSDCPIIERLASDGARLARSRS
jgi:MerR family mercuric resistance operon transcriptional regulator